MVEGWKLEAGSDGAYAMQPYSMGRLANNVAASCLAPVSVALLLRRDLAMTEYVWESIVSAIKPP